MNNISAQPSQSMQNNGKKEDSDSSEDSSDSSDENENEKEKETVKVPLRTQAMTAVLRMAINRHKRRCKRAQ